MTDQSQDMTLQQDPQALIKLAKLTQSLKHLGEVAKAVNLEASALAQHFDTLLANVPSAEPEATAAEISDFSTTAYETSDTAVSFQDIERRRRYYAGLPPVDELDAAFQQAMREAENRSRIAQGGLPLDDDDDLDD
ncbi:MAG: hypothetical protein V2J55_08570 [Candidatus Competibacteraceae bacterium]|jgi:hypothetical protein|nr:hypothetical protein [Candidatus Competibacteraceae bacterium]